MRWACGVKGTFLAERVVLCLVAAGCFLVALPSHARGGMGAGGGGPIEYSEPALSQVPSYAPGAVRPVPYSGPAPMYFDFYPMAGRHDQDVVLVNYVDMDSSAGILDWDCSSYTYNGHDASDASPLSFGEQFIGVPIFAVADGTVLQAHDGEFDMNTCSDATPCVNPPANFVAIDHGDGVVAYYYHMKKDSVAVQVGETVRAGRQIGLVGSSGNSSGPHLHFATYRNGQVVEPFAGPCHDEATWWTQQPPLTRSLVVSDFGITHEDLSSYPGLPYELPREGQIALSDPYIRVWFQMYNLPVNSTWRFRFQRPDGTFAYTSDVGNFNNGVTYRSAWYWFYWDIADMHAITGTWHVLVDINGVIVINAPVVVRAARIDGYNRPPEAVQATFAPASPSPDDVVFCNVDAPLILDDPDYDLVRFDYAWTVNGTEVRRVTSAARSDAIPAGMLHPGDVLACTVTPSDGKVDGAPTSVTYTLESPQVDSDGDGLLDDFESACGLSPTDTDTDDDGLTDGAEVGYDGDAATYSPYDPVTNPTGTDLNATLPDSDGDGISDQQEVNGGHNPLDPADLPGMSGASKGSLAALILLMAAVPMGVLAGRRASAV